MLELASGVINVLEKNLLSRQDQERMLKSPDKDKAFDVLFDTDLADFAAKTRDIENILQNDFDRTKKILSGIVGEDKDFLKYLFLRQKSFFLKKRLKEGALNEKKSDKMARTVLRKLKKIDERKRNSRIIEVLVDKEYFKEKILLAKRIDRFLFEATRLEIDLANLKKLLKKRKINRDFIDGGNLKKQEVKKLAALKEGEIFQDLKRFLEVYSLSLIVEKYKEPGNSMYLENGLQSFFSERIFNRAKDDGFGYAKVLAFFQKKLNSAANIRLIMSSKENKIDFEKVLPCLLPI